MEELTKFKELLAHYRTLPTSFVRDIIMKSVTKVDYKVKYKNDKGENVKIPFADICVSGGIVNAYNALLLAETYHPKM